MKQYLGLGMAMTAGALLGAIIVTGLHAQAKPPVYQVVDISEITDAEGYKTIGGRTAAGAAAVFKEFGGQSIARTDNITALDGAAPKRFIITRFDSVEKAKGFYNSPQQKKVNEIRMKSTKSRSFIVEGL